MLKLLSKFIVPCVGGGGVVCGTMHLTNTSGGLLNSLNLLTIQNKPEIDESELQPKKQQDDSSPQPSQQESSGGQQDTQQQQETPQAGGSDSAASSSSSASASATAAQGSLTPEEAVRAHAGRMIQSGWLADLGSLTKNHDIISTLENLSNALQQLATTSNDS